MSAEPASTTPRLAQNANHFARGTLAVVLALGLGLIIAPLFTTGVDVLDDDPFRPHEQTTTVVKTTATGAVERTVTTRPSDTTIVERALDDGGMLVARLALVVLAAFVAGAVVQRAILAQFSFKLGSLEIPEVQQAAEQSSEAIAHVAAAVKELGIRVDAHGKELIDNSFNDAKALDKQLQLARAVQEASETSATQLQQQVDELRQRIDGLDRSGSPIPQPPPAAS